MGSSVRAALITCCAVCAPAQAINKILFRDVYYPQTGACLCVLVCGVRATIGVNIIYDIWGGGAHKIRWCARRFDTRRNDG